MAKDRNSEKDNGDEKPGGEVSLKKAIKRAHDFSKPYRIDNGKGFRLKDVDPADTGHLDSEDKARGKDALAQGVQALAKLQDMLYAQDRWSVLCVFQAMDAAGNFVVAWNGFAPPPVMMIRMHTPGYQKKMVALVSQHPQLLELLKERSELVERYEVVRKRKSGQKTFAWD